MNDDNLENLQAILGRNILLHRSVAMCAYKPKSIFAMISLLIPA